jgi:alpha-ribazole phosphatase/probable phosphoglycerate mutase
MRATRAILIRHGEPESDTRGRCYGRLDVGLSSAGRAQADRLGAALAAEPIVAIYASPRVRAVESARPLAAARGLTVEIRDGLREIDFGALEGLTYDEAAARHPDFYAAWMRTPTEVQFPGGESYHQVRTRVLETMQPLVATHAGAAFAVVAHGGVTRTILAAALNMRDADIFRIAQDYACVNVVDYVDDTTIVRSLNDLSCSRR